MEFLDKVILQNTVRAWAEALVLAGAVFIVLRVVVRWAIRRLAKWSKGTATNWDDVVVSILAKTKSLFLLFVALYAGALTLELGGSADKFFRSAAVIALLVQGGIWTSAALTAWLGAYRKRELSTDPASVTTVNALGFLGKLVLWVVVMLMVLDNMGVNITALVAGVSVGGVAIAFALQNILGDLFASLSIVLDKPFVIGDFLIVDDKVGTVENIGLKSTRVRSLWGEQLVFSNADLLKSRLRNFGRMFERRIVFKIGVTYDTPRTKLEMIPTIIREALQEHDKVRFDRSHFMEYGDFSLNFETAYYVLVADYNTYMDIQQAVYLKIHQRFEEEGIEFAFPTQTLYVEKSGGSGS